MLDVQTANLEVQKWLRDVANVREHQTTLQPPLLRWEQERDLLLPYQGLPARAVALPVKVLQLPIHAFEPINLQHALSVHEATLVEDCA